MTTKNSRRRTAVQRAIAEANQRYPDQTTKGRHQRTGFVAGVMWHREHPWHEDTQPSEPEHDGFDHCPGCQAAHQTKEAAKDAG